MSLADKAAELNRVSVLIAQRAAEDSSAMKTIAVMTMLFLPGTFFAALFALPLLKWDESNVIQKKFWVYWAFTLPATVLVFIVWKVLTSRLGGWLVTLIKGKVE
jgi:Mg2+ and Co2+ transporter CorA